jgi:hypothetical protein
LARAWPTAVQIPRDPVPRGLRMPAQAPLRQLRVSRSPKRSVLLVPSLICARRIRLLPYSRPLLARSASVTT